MQNSIEAICSQFGEEKFAKIRVSDVGTKIE